MTRVRPAGFALIEVLVAAALLAIGLLGHLALLVTALRSERVAADLATATTLVADLAERIRTNRSAALLYAFDSAARPTPAAACAIGVPSSAAARAACDLDDSLREAMRSLPGPTLRVTATPVTGSSAVACTIILRWQAQDLPGGERALQMLVR